MEKRPAENEENGAENGAKKVKKKKMHLFMSLYLCRTVSCSRSGLDHLSE